MQAEWRKIIDDNKVLEDIDEHRIWNVYPFEEDGIVFLVSNGVGSTTGEVHVHFRAPARPLRAGPEFMRQVWGRTGLDRLFTWIRKGNTRVAAWATRYGWSNTHEPGLLGTEMWEIKKW